MYSLYITKANIESTQYKSNGSLISIQYLCHNSPTILCVHSEEKSPLPYSLDCKPGVSPLKDNQQQENGLVSASQSQLVCGMYDC